MDRQDIQNASAPAPEAPETPAEQPLFENVSAVGYEGYLQCYQKILLHSARMKILLVVMALCLVDIILQWEMVLANPMSLLPFVAVASLMLLILFVYVPRKQAKQTVGRIKELNGRIPENRASFFQDRVVLHNTVSNGDVSLRYENIVNCQETRDLILLITKQKLYYPLVKAGFSGTDEQGFKQFMRKKAPTAKFHWK